MKLFTSALLSVLAFSPIFVSGRACGAQVAAPVVVSVDARGPATPFPHFWEHVFGSGRAILSLRESYRADLRAVKAVTELDAVRFHGIFMDEVGLYDPDRKVIQFAQMAGAKAGPAAGTGANQAGGLNAEFNFSYIDQIYDGLLKEHVRPFVELSFMPRAMASDPAALHAFWYKQNVSPPKDYAVWDRMIEALARHVVERYGIDEVAHWSFEVWNEPNIDFWAGSPKQTTYFELYDHTARAIKKVNSRLRIGGPSTAQAAWVAAFLAHCKEKNVPVDFASSHVYANDTAKDVMGTEEVIPRDRMVCRSVRKVHDEIAASAFPKLPLIFSEYNASYANEPNVTDSIYMGPWLATTISQCDGLTEAMSYWTFSDVFEEQGVVRTPFYGGFGLMAVDGIEKPAFHAFAMLHRLGTERLQVTGAGADSVLATRGGPGGAGAAAAAGANKTLALALWNYAAPVGTGAAYTPEPAGAGAEKVFTVRVAGVAANARMEMWRVDEDHGNVVKAYDAMGRPEFPTREQIAALQAAGRASAAESVALEGGAVTVRVPARGLVVLTMAK